MYSNEGTCLKFILNTATARNPRLCSPRSTPLTALCHPSQTQSQPHLHSILLPLPPLQGHSTLPSANPAALSHSFRSTQLTPRMFHGEHIFVRVLSTFIKVYHYFCFLWRFLLFFSIKYIMIPVLQLFFNSSGSENITVLDTLGFFVLGWGDQLIWTQTYEEALYKSKTR